MSKQVVYIYANDPSGDRNGDRSTPTMEKVSLGALRAIFDARKDEDAMYEKVGALTLCSDAASVIVEAVTGSYGYAKDMKKFLDKPKGNAFSIFGDDALIGGFGFDKDQAMLAYYKEYDDI